MKNFLFKALATGLGVGYFPVAPGTVGSLWGVALYAALHRIGLVSLMIGTIVFTGVAIWIAFGAEQADGVKDSQKIVIDEIAGQFITLLFAPYSFLHLVIGFVLFRLFDVIKIFPARWAQDRLPGGFGVVMDDVIAGLQAGIVLWFLSFYF